MIVLDRPREAVLLDSLQVARPKAFDCPLKVTTVANLEHTDQAIVSEPHHALLSAYLDVDQKNQADSFPFYYVFFQLFYF